MTHWSHFIHSEKELPYLQNTLSFIEQRRKQGVNVYPNNDDIFSAFESCEFQNVKVVILGQDPYHGENQAHGLSFSVRFGIKTPPSLVNIYKELNQDIASFQIPNHGNLQYWADQGVLLLNTVLTVEEGNAHSHKHLGWEEFTQKAIACLNAEREGIVFLLWGAHAQKKGAEIDREKHHVLLAPHPSPLSAHRGFFGCKHFSKTNELLLKQGDIAIDWCLENEEEPATNIKNKNLSLDF